MGFQCPAHEFWVCSGVRTEHDEITREQAEQAETNHQHKGTVLFYSLEIKGKSFLQNFHDGWQTKYIINFFSDNVNSLV